MTGLPRRLLCAALLLLATPAAWAQTQITWEAYTYWPVATPAGARQFIRIIDAVKQKTNGQFVINLHLGGSLPINATSVTAAVADGVVQLADDGFNTGNVPIAAALRLPLLLQTAEEFAKASALLWPYLEAGYAKKGVLALNQYAYPVQVMWSRKKLTELNDVKGMKLRVTSVEQGEFIRRAGGVPLTIGTADVAASLDRGVVDGMLTASAGGGIPWHELVKYRYAFPVSFVNSNVVVNREAFDKLPAEFQKILREAALEAATWADGEMTRQEAEYTAQFAKEGLQLADATAEDIKRGTEMMRSYWDEWAKKHGPDAVELMKKVRALTGR